MCIDSFPIFAIASVFYSLRARPPQTNFDYPELDSLSACPPQSHTHRLFFKLASDVFQRLPLKNVSAGNPPAPQKNLTGFARTRELSQVKGRTFSLVVLSASWTDWIAGNSPHRHCFCEAFFSTILVQEI